MLFAAYILRLFMLMFFSLSLSLPLFVSQCDQVQVIPIPDVCISYSLCLLVPALLSVCPARPFLQYTYTHQYLFTPNPFSGFYISYYDVRNLVSNHIMLLTPELSTPFKKVCFRPGLIYQTVNKFFRKLFAGVFTPKKKSCIHEQLIIS